MRTNRLIKTQNDIWLEDSVEELRIYKKDMKNDFTPLFLRLLLSNIYPVAV